MDSKSTDLKISPSSLKFPPIIIRKDLHSLITRVKKMQPVTTYEEVLEGLKIYIRENKLYDPAKPWKVCCKDDALSAVVGVDEFTIYDVKSFLPKMVIPVSSVKCDPDGTSESVSDIFVKRKLDDYFEPIQKKLCAEVDSSQSVSQSSQSSLILHLSPLESGNTSDSSDSVGCESTFVKNDCDVVPSSLLTEEVFSQDDNILAVEETYSIEYEVESDSDDTFSSSSLSDSEADIAAAVALDAALLTLVCKTDSDIEFFADDSSEEDIEIPESDQWKCNKCKCSNSPTSRYCSKCFKERLEWLPEKYEAIKKKRRKRKNASFSQTKQKSEESSEVSPESLSSSQQSSDACSSATSIAKLCIICCTKPAAASIVHGKYAHQICCYRCARTLQKRKKRCPICRRTIDRVVHQISIT